MRISDWSSDVCSSDLAARSIPSREALEDYLKALADVTELRHVVALAGAVDRPLGPFESSMAILETGLFDKYGVETIGVAGHPEGSPDIAPSALQEALAWKNAFAGRSDAQLYIARSEEHTSELQSLMRISYAVFCLTKKNKTDSD